ncbi:MAG: MFS transporter [Actinomycetota bacterium]
MSQRREDLRRQLQAAVGVQPKWAVLWVVLAGLFTTGFTITVLVVSLEHIAERMGSSVSVLTWAITAPMLAFGVVGPAFGKAGDLWGHKRIFVGGLLLAAVFAALSALAWDPASLILFRTLSATAGSACGPSAMAYINRVFPAGERVKPLSYWSFVTAGSPVLGVVAAAPLVDHVSWRAIFVLQAPLCLIGAVVAWWLLPATDRRDGVRFDIPGSVTLGVGASSLLAGISQGRIWGWGSAPTVACFVVSAIAMAVFVWVEQRAAEPLVVLRWFRARNLAFPAISQLLTNFAYMGGFFLIPQVLGRPRGFLFATTTVGMFVIARPLAFSLIAPIAGSVTMRVGERAAGVVGALVLVGSMLMWARISLGDGYLVIVVATALSGIGLGIASPALTSLMTTAVDPSDIGVVGALQQLMNQLGGVLGSAVLATLSSSAAHDDFGPFHTAFAVAAAVATLGALAAGFVRSTPR